MGRLLALGACALALACAGAASSAPTTFPGRDGLIAFVRSPVDAAGDPLDPDIWVVRPDGTGLRDLTPLPGAQTEPDWAPDGSALAFVQRSAVWVMHVNGGRRRRLTRGRQPSWSADGTRIAFARGASIWTVDSSGGRPRRLTRPRRREADSSPAWSPDGRTIAFYRDSADEARAGLWFVRPDGRGVRRGGAVALADTLAWTPSGRLSVDRGWSPNGRFLAEALESPDAPGQTELYVARADRSHAVRVTFSPQGVSVEDPVWQPVCTIRGTARADRLVGTPGHDVICGFGGNDRIFGRAGNDVVLGGDGNDTIVGGPGKDRLFGGRGNDTILARDGQHDVVDGGPGRDRLVVDRHDLATR